MRLRPTLLAGLALLLGSTAGAQTTLDFNDGAYLEEVGSRYASSGVTLQNAVFGPGEFPNFGPCCALYRLDVVDGQVGASFLTPPSTPIVALFASSQRAVSVVGLDVGIFGFQLKAFGATGDLLDFQSYLGTGVGTGQNHTLTVAAEGIRRVEFSQLYTRADYANVDPLAYDPAAFDDLTFTPSSTVPEPGTWALLGTGLLAVGAIARRRRA